LNNEQETTILEENTDTSSRSRIHRKRKGKTTEEDAERATTRNASPEN
jgi:hypothetical protein